MFKIQEKDKPETAIWLTKDCTALCNDQSGDMFIKVDNDEKCRVEVLMENERPYLFDKTFNQQIFFNDQPIPAGSKRAMDHGDLIQIGHTILEIINAKKAVAKLDSGAHDKIRQGEFDYENWTLKAKGNWLDGQLFTITGKKVLGRDQSCDITIPGSHLSRRHVELVATQNKLIMRDLDSANGSFVNGKRKKTAELKDGDLVKFDVLTFKVIAPGEKYVPPDKRKTIESSAINMPLPDLASVDDAMQKAKNWVTKPTSIGNRENDTHDIILAKYQRNKRIFYGIFFFAVFAITIGALLAL